MDLLYKIFIYLHVFSAITSIGPFFILLAVIKKMNDADESELHAYLHTFRFVISLTKHSGHVLTSTGVLLVLLGPWTFLTPWIMMTLIILFCSLFFLARAFSPTLRKFHKKDHNRQLLTKKLNRSIWIYLILLSIMLFFMVVKPAL